MQSIIMYEDTILNQKITYFILEMKYEDIKNDIIQESVMDKLKTFKKFILEKIETLVKLIKGAAIKFAKFFIEKFKLLKKKKQESSSTEKTNTDIEVECMDIDKCIELLEKIIDFKVKKVRHDNMGVRADISYMLDKVGLDKTLEILQEDIDDNYVEEFIDKVKEEREDILKSKKKFKQSYIDSKLDELLNLEKRIGEFAGYKDEEYQLELLKKSVRDLKPDDIENSVDRVVKKYTQLCAITINRTNNLIGIFRSIFNDLYEECSKHS